MADSNLDAEQEPFFQHLKPREVAGAMGIGRRERRPSHSPIIRDGRPSDLQPLPVIDPSTWQGQEPPARRWLVDGYIPESNVSLLSGDGGMGKSLLALQLLAAAALGKSWLGIPTRPCKCVGLFAEDDRDELHRRIFDILRHYDAAPADLEGRLLLVDRVGEDNALVEYGKPWESGNETAFYYRLRDLVKGHGAELVVIDSLHDFFVGTENDRRVAREFVQILRGLARELGGAVLINMHPSVRGRDTGSGEAGTTGWRNAVRSQLFLSGQKRDEDDEPDNDFRLLKKNKGNYDGLGGALKLRWHDGVFVREEPASGMVAAIERSKVDRTFLACLDAVLAQGRAVSDSRNATNFAPRLFASMSEAGGLKDRDFATAMERLFAAGTIRIGTHGFNASRHPKSSIIRAAAQEVQQ